MITVMGKKVTLEQVRKVKLRTPDGAGTVWNGIPHGELVDAILDEVRSRGWEVRGQKFALSNDGTSLAAAFEVEGPRVKLPKGQTLSLGVSTGNNRHQALKLVVGTTVTVCENGFVSGEVALKRNHTSGLDIHKELDEALDGYVEKAKGIAEMVETLQAARMTNADAQDMLFAACLKNRPTYISILPWAAIGDVYKEWLNPSFKEFKSRTAWSFLNAFTFVTKKAPPLQQIPRCQRFLDLLSDYTPIYEGVAA
jgi:hypothetical protein